MKKRRIRYSELAPVPPETQPEAPDADQPVQQAPKPRRVSTPVELARALAAAREAEAATASAIARELPVPGEVERAAVSADGALAAVGSGAARDSATTLEPTPNRAELLIFTVGAERFALPLTEVEEAVDLPVIHFVPEMPESMLGVISLRGGLVPVYSPSGALGQPLGSRRSALIFRTAARRVGVVVDEVEDAVIVEEQDLRELPGAAADDLVVAVLHHDRHLISVMRGDNLVAACRGARMPSTP